MKFWIYYIILSMDNNIKYSIVIPIFNESEILTELYKRLVSTMNAISDSYEIILVDDGSRDGSYEIIRSLHFKDGRVKALRFTRNFGHHVAITAGLDHSRGDSIILMDGDLQDPPEDILKLDKKFKEGYEIVYAVRKTRKDTLAKKISSKAFYKMFRVLANVEIPADTGIFRIMSRKAADYLKDCREKSRFIVALLNWAGFSSAGVEIDRGERYAGKTKYGIIRSAKLAIDGLTSFSNFPIRLIIYVGSFVAFASFLLGIAVTATKIYNGMPAFGYDSIIIALFFIGGVQLSAMGIIGEYIGRIYDEVRNRPLYVVNEKLGIE